MKNDSGDVINDAKVGMLLLAALDQHCESCPTCRGPNDGCGLGGAIEAVMLSAADGNVYGAPAKQVINALAEASARFLFGKTHVQ